MFAAVDPGCAAHSSDAARRDMRRRHARAGLAHVATAAPRRQHVDAGGRQLDVRVRVGERRDRVGRPDRGDRHDLRQAGGVGDRRVAVVAGRRHDQRPGLAAAGIRGLRGLRDRPRRRAAEAHRDHACALDVRPAHARRDVGDRAGAVGAERAADDQRRGERDARDAHAVAGDRADRARDVRPVALAVGAVAVGDPPCEAAPHALTRPARSSWAASMPVSMIPTGAPPDRGTRRARAADQKPGAPILPDAVQVVPQGVVGVAAGQGASRSPARREHAQLEVRLGPLHATRASQPRGGGGRIALDAHQSRTGPGDEPDGRRHARGRELGLRRALRQARDDGAVGDGRRRQGEGGAGEGGGDRAERRGEVTS